MYHISNIVHKLFQSPLSKKSSDNEHASRQRTFRTSRLPLLTDLVLQQS